jgi:glycosyltransferase involved in cell wall biosynthesis
MSIKICFGIDSLRIGGAERLVVELLKLLSSDSDYEIHLVTFSSVNEFIEDNFIDQIRRVIVPKVSKFRTLRWLGSYFKNNNIDCCITHLEHSNKLFSIAGKLTRVPVICVTHSINIYSNGRIKASIASLIYRWFAYKVVAISPTVKQYLEALHIPIKKITLINNGVNSQALNNKYCYNPSENGLKIIVVGRVEFVKGLDLLLDALAEFDDVYSNWQLKIIGSGQIIDALKTQAIDLNIIDKIIFLGQQSLPWSYLENEQLLCMPSRREGLPMTLLEAFSIGIPAITSNVGYLPELVLDGKSGFIFQSEDKNRLLNKLISFYLLTKSEKLVMSKFAQSVADKYDLESCLEQYLKLVNMAIEDYE